MLRYLEIATSIAVLLTTVFVAALLVRTHPPSEADTFVPGLAAGTPMPTGGNIEYERADRTLVLALDARCRFCAEGAAFYQALANRIQASAGGSQIVALFPNSRTDAYDFMVRHGLMFPFKETTDFRSLRVDRTPTLIVVDRSGKVLQTWVGKLGSIREREVALALNLN